MAKIKVRTPRQVFRLIKEDAKHSAFTTGFACGALLISLMGVILGLT